MGQLFQSFRGIQTKCGADVLFPDGNSKVGGVLAKSIVCLCQSLFLSTTNFRFLQNMHMSVHFVLDAEGGRVDARAAPQLYIVHEAQQQRHLIPLIKPPTLQVDFDREPENNSSVEED